MIRSNQATCITQRPDRHTMGSAFGEGQTPRRRSVHRQAANWRWGRTCWLRLCRGTATTTRMRFCSRSDWFATTCSRRFISRSTNWKPAIPKLGPEEMTRDIPNVGEDALEGSGRPTVSSASEPRSAPDDHSSSGKVAPKGQGELTAEERLIIAIFGKKAEETRDVSPCAFRTAKKVRSSMSRCSRASSTRTRDRPRSYELLEATGPDTELVSPYEWARELERLSARRIVRRVSTSWSACTSPRSVR